MLGIVLNRPKTENEMAKNHVGFYIDEFHWDKVQG